MNRKIIEQIANQAHESMMKTFRSVDHAKIDEAEEKFRKFGESVQHVATSPNEAAKEFAEYIAIFQSIPQTPTLNLGKSSSLTGPRFEDGAGNSVDVNQVYETGFYISAEDANVLMTLVTQFLDTRDRGAM